MLKNKKYFAADGTQLAEYFMEIMNITQGVDDSFSHKGTKNMDDASRDTGIDPAFAPFDGTISWKQTTGDMTGILFSSDKPVKTKKFGDVYVNVLMWHDNSTADVFKGKKITQGEHLYDEGTAGHATGNHIHYGVSLGKFTGGYPLVRNEFGNWELPNEVNPFDVFFVDDTTIKNGGGYSWETYKEIPVEKPAEVIKPNPTTLKLGDKVKIIGTHYVTGQVVPSSIKDRTHTIEKISKDRCLLKEIKSWVYEKDLKKV